MQQIIYTTTLTPVTGYSIKQQQEIKYHQLWWNSLWLWRWLPHRLSKRRSLSTTVLFRTNLTRASMLHQLMKIQNERKRLCGHLTQVQAEKNMWDFNVIYVTAIDLRRAFMSVNLCKINNRFNFCCAAQPLATASPCSKKLVGWWGGGW